MDRLGKRFSLKRRGFAPSFGQNSGEISDETADETGDGMATPATPVEKTTQQDGGKKLNVQSRCCSEHRIAGDSLEN
jgi:hypothetical protein